MAHTCRSISCPLSKVHLWTFSCLPRASYSGNWGILLLCIPIASLSQFTFSFVRGVAVGTIYGGG